MATEYGSNTFDECRIGEEAALEAKVAIEAGKATPPRVALGQYALAGEAGHEATFRPAEKKNPPNLESMGPESPTSATREIFALMENRFPKFSKFRFYR